MAWLFLQKKKLQLQRSFFRQLHAFCLVRSPNLAILNDPTKQRLFFGPIKTWQISEKNPTIWENLRFFYNMSIYHIPMKLESPPEFYDVDRKTSPNVLFSRILFITFHGHSCDTWLVLWFRRRFQNPDNQPADSTITQKQKGRTILGLLMSLKPLWFSGFLFTPVRCKITSVCPSNHPRICEISLHFSQLPNWIVLFSGFLQPFIPLFCLAALLFVPKKLRIRKAIRVIRLMEEIRHQLRLVVYPIIYKVWYIPGGAGFLPSTVVMRETLAVSINPKKIWSGPTSLVRFRCMRGYKGFVLPPVKSHPSI